MSRGGEPWRASSRTVAEASMAISSVSGQTSTGGASQRSRANQPEIVLDVLDQGSAARSFERRFQLADGVQVTGASLENGLLHIDLVREIPEAKKPRQIQIGSSRPAPTIDAEVKQAA